MSVLELMEDAAKLGCTFARDPWTGAAILLDQELAPAVLRNALAIRWDDVEAVLAEQSPPASVALGLAELLLTPAR